MLLKMAVLLFPMWLIAAEGAVKVPPAPLSPPTAPKKSLKDMLPQECATIPPMLVVLPPPMQKDMNRCKNAFHKPKPETVNSNLAAMHGEKVNVTNISALDGFQRLYQIDYTMDGFFGEKKKTIYCNETVTQCLFGELKKAKEQK